MDTTIRSGIAARTVITVSMLRGPPLDAGIRRPRDGTTRSVRLSRPILVLAVLAGLLGLAGCGDGDTGLEDAFGQARDRVDDILAEAGDRTGADLREARRRAAAALEEARAEARGAIDEARADGRPREEIDELRREAGTRLRELRERIESELGR
jgi:ElaB/YqjD/DUF883 family membrane-anchored ribosome-binding protein